MGTTETTTTVTPFWYRRISEITWLLTLILAGLWAAGTFFIHSDIAAMNLLVPIPSLVGAGIASLMMLIAYIRKKHVSSNQLITLGYALMLLTSLYTVVATGDTSSPFIALWLLVSIFAAIFGLSMFIPAAIATNIYLAYLYFFDIVTNEELLIFLIAFEVPLIASFLIWRKGVKQVPVGGTESDSTFKALAKELSQVSNKAEIVINAIADGVVAVDGQGIVQLINPAAQQIIGWGRQDALKLDYRSVLKLFDTKDQDVPDSLDPVQRCLHTNEMLETDELLLATTSGKKLMVSLHVSPVGQIGAGAIIVFRDITNQRQEERQQAEFISTASHEMRTPVAAIEGYLGLALNPQTATIDEKAKAYLLKAHESAQHLGRLFQDLLDISKAEDGRLDSDPRVIDVVSFARDITLSFDHMAKAKGLVLLYKPDTGIGADQRVNPAFYAKVDPDHIREVVANLIENGIKYTKAGDVTVDVTGDDEHVTLKVSDTGIGIPSEDIAHLFQKFYRIDNTDTREIGGTGLGLYLCRRLVEAMGGRIFVTSDYGKGSTFHVELPRLSNMDAMQEIESAAAEPTVTQLHATPSFLASEEEAAALKQAAVAQQPTPPAQPQPAPAQAPAPAAAPQPPVQPAPQAAPAAPAPQAVNQPVATSPAARRMRVPDRSAAAAPAPATTPAVTPTAPQSPAPNPSAGPQT